MKKTLLFAIAFIGAITFSFAQKTSILYVAAGATSQTFDVGTQGTDDLDDAIAAITSATGTVATNAGFIGFLSDAVADDATTGTFTLSTDSATSIDTDLTLEVAKRKGISTAGTVSVTGYPDLPFSYPSEGSETGVENKSIEFGKISLSGTAVTVTITLTSMIHAESTQRGTFRLKNVIVAGEDAPATPTEISYDAAAAGDQTFTVGKEATDDLQADIAAVTSTTGTVTTNNNFIGFLSTDVDAATVTSGTFTFTLTTDSASSIDKYLTLDFGKRAGCTVEGTVSVTGKTAVPFSFVTTGDAASAAIPAVVDFGIVSLITGTNLTVVVTLTSMTSVDNTDNAIFRLENVLVNENAPLSVNDNNIINNIGLYPNPVANSFHIDSSIDIENVKLYNITGKLLKTFNRAANYDISDLAAGIYIANIKTLSGSKALRVVKE